MNAAPPGALCSQHPDVAALGSCARCGSFFCPRCTVDFDHCTRCPATPVLADAGIRLVAHLIDSFVWVVPAVGLGLIGFFVGHAFETGQPEDLPGSVGIGVVMAFCALPAVLGVQIFFLVRFGRSLGKWLLGLRVIRTDGTPAEVWRIIFLRNVLLHALAQFCALVGLVDALMIFGHQRRCLHDYLADTLVVVDPREPFSAPRTERLASTPAPVSAKAAG